MRATEKSVLESLADIMVPRGGILEAGARELNVTATIEHYLEVMPSRSAKKISLLIKTFDASPRFVRGFTRSFHRLDSGKQVEWIDRVHRSRSWMKIPLTYLEQLILVAYVSSPEVEDSIGFDYTCRRDAEVHGRK